MYYRRNKVVLWLYFGRVIHVLSPCYTRNFVVFWSYFSWFDKNILSAPMCCLFGNSCSFTNFHKFHDKSTMNQKNFQNVKSRQDFVEIWTFHRHSDFTWNQICQIPQFRVSEIAKNWPTWKNWILLEKWSNCNKVKHITRNIDLIWRKTVDNLQSGSSFVISRKFFYLRVLGLEQLDGIFL